MSRVRARQVSRIGVTIALVVTLAPALALAQAPNTNMIHVVDARYISNRTEIAPAGLVIVMSFADRDGTMRAHTLTADDGASFDIHLAMPQNATDFTETNFTAPATPGEYAFHDAASSARGVLVVVAPPGYHAPASAKSVPGPSVAVALVVIGLLARARRS